MEGSSKDRNDDKSLCLCVTKVREELVKPACHTPSELLYLSNLDDQPGSRSTCQTIHVYSSSNNKNVSCEEEEEEEEKDPVSVIRASLSKVLVHYYPLAGRLAESQHAPGKLQVLCEQQGALLVEAAANCSLEQVDYFSRLSPALKQLVPQYPISVPHHHIPPLVLQVTRFKCGGWVLGLALSHVMADGVGFGNFLSAMAEMGSNRAQATEAPSVKPVWMRHLLKPRNPPRPEFQHPELRTRQDNENHPKNLDGPSGQTRLPLSPPGLLIIQQSFEITGDSIERLKSSVLGHWSLKKCTTFEAMAAFVWKTRVQALADGGFLADRHETAPLCFAANMRAACGVFPGAGYYGNAINCAYVGASVAELRERHVAELVAMIQAAKRGLTGEHVVSAVDFIEVNRERLAPPPLAYLYLTDWTRVPLWRPDFGWGPAVHVSVVDVPFVCLVIFMPCPRVPRPGDVEGGGNRAGAMRVVASLPAKAMGSFAASVAAFQRQSQSSDFQFG